MAKKESEKKYTRREFLKYSGKAGANAVVYGAGTGISIKLIKDYLNRFTTQIGNKLVDLDNRVDELSEWHPARIAKNAETWRGRT